MVTQQPRRVRLEVESLERREVPAAVPVTVMSENLYLGADPLPALLVKTTLGPVAAIPATTQFWNNVQATNFRERADAIVGQIVVNKPVLIGLQEVTRYWTGPPDSLWGNPTRANHLELDFLQVLRNKLKARGVPYQVVNVTRENESEGALFVKGALRDLRMEDNVAILARQDVLFSGAMKLSNIQGKTFVNRVSNTVNRGWDSVDVNYGGHNFRFINMCLETPAAPQVQALQARELLLGPAVTWRPVILVGDSNNTNPSPPNGVYSSTTSRLFTATGFKDAWLRTHPTAPGYTWGNRPDLRNPVPLSYTLLGLGPYRMDLVLYRGGAIQARSMKRVGVLPWERTVSGMWPSDHAGVVATLVLP
jgi:endonuclease/exonuclease/phosphatase family metal-dependent hydrolase